LHGSFVRIRRSYLAKCSFNQSHSQAFAIVSGGIIRPRHDPPEAHRYRDDAPSLQGADVQRPSVGHRRPHLQIWLHTHQTRPTYTMLIAWRYRTGDDINPQFSEWQSPPRSQPAAARPRSAATEQARRLPERVPGPTIVLAGRRSALETSQVESSNRSGSFRKRNRDTPHADYLGHLAPELSATIHP